MGEKVAAVPFDPSDRHRHREKPRQERWGRHRMRCHGPMAVTTGPPHTLEPLGGRGRAAAGFSVRARALRFRGPSHPYDHGGGDRAGG
jgi:hypothetical protein